MWGELYEVKISRTVLKTSRLWRHSRLSLTTCLDNKSKLYQYKTDYNRTTRGTKFDNLTLTNIPRISSDKQSFSSKNFRELLYEIVVAKYLPPSLIIDDNLDIVHTHGDLSMYLQIPQGMVNLNLTKMIHPSLAVPLNVTLQNAKKRQESLTYSFAFQVSQEESRNLKIQVEPVQQPKNADYQSNLWIIIFEEAQTDIDTDVASQSLDVDKMPAELIQHNQQLEQELQSTRETLQAALEQVENSNEELQSTNEELLASNEELQTTNEELQAVNEELITVNAEHQRKIQELTDLNDDVNNLLRSTHIGTVFLDSSLRIRRFTPELTKEINIIDSDLGRPFEHITHNLKYDHFMEDIETVLLGHGVKKIKVANKTGNWYLLQISPYITAERTVQGVVVTLVNYEQSNESFFK